MNNRAIARKGYYIVGQKWTKDGLKAMYKLRPDLSTWKQYTRFINGEQAESVRAESHMAARKAFESLYYLEEAEH